MKVSAYVWDFVLNQIADYNVDNSQWLKFLKLTKNNQYLNTPKDEMYSDLIEEMAEEVSQIDLKTDQKLKEIFFDNFKTMPDYYKKKCFDDDNFLSTKEDIAYFLREMIKNPEIYELFLFRKKLTVDQLNIGIMNYIDSSIKENKSNIWEDILSIANINKLLTLLKLSSLKEEGIASFKHMEFKDKYKQLEFNNIFLLEKANEDIIEINKEDYYSIHVKVKELEIKKSFPDYSQEKVESIFHFLNIMFQECLESKKFIIDKKNSEESIYLTNNKSIYEKDKKVAELFKKELVELIPIIQKKYFNNSMLNKSEINTIAKDIGQKIILKGNLEELPTNKVKKMRKI